ncbi:F-box only protein 41-like isoform X2 [Lineus longissimus]|uniref:F-box only protein 41-like isoform X2 n=1 Tax=Lineus longissimus TaxID=88925 RepID=UPI00315C5FB4
MADPRDFPYQCPTCGQNKRFLTLVGLWSHLENKHPKHGHNLDTLDTQKACKSGEQNGRTPTQQSSPTAQFMHRHPMADKRLNRLSREGRELDRQLVEAKEKERNHKYSSLDYRSPTKSVFSPRANNFDTHSLKDVPVSRNNISQHSRTRSSDDLLDHHDSTDNINVYAEMFNDDVFTPPGSPNPQYQRVNLSGSYNNLSTAQGSPNYDEVLELVERLKGDLHVKELRLHRANNELEDLAMERRKTQHEIIAMSKEKDTNQGTLDQMRKDLDEKDSIIREKEKEVINLTQFLRNTAEKEATARAQLEEFINGLINRAERAENELSTLRRPQGHYSSLQPQPSAGSPMGMDYTSPGASHASQTMGNNLHPVERGLVTGRRVDGNHQIEDQIVPVNLQRNFKSPSPQHLRSSMDDLSSDFLEPSFRDDSQQPVYPGKNPFSCSDSGVGSSIPSYKTHAESPKKGPKISSTDFATLQEKEKQLKEELNKVREMQRNCRRKRMRSATSTMTEPSIDYSSDSMTNVTDDTDPDYSLEESLGSLQRQMETDRPRTGTRKKSQKSREEGFRSLGKSPKWPQQPTPVYTQAEVDKRRRDVLFGVFMFLDTINLSKVALVCKEWRNISRHPALWRNVRLGKSKISAKYLVTLSKWATQVRCLTLMGLKPRSKKPQETMEDYIRQIRGSLESGIEQLLRANAASLVTLKLVDCRNLLTDRTLWMASCHCRKLKQVVYISETDPACAEVLWSLGSGCKEIKDLIVPPIYPNEKALVFNDACCETIGRMWPLLHILCIGGTAITGHGLVAIASQCARLQILELDHMGEMTEHIAQAMCKAGLRGLEVLDFTFTRVTPEALTQFNSSCSRLRSISVHIGISDYFHEKGKAENIQQYEQIVKKFKALRDQPAFNGVLTVQTDYG